MSNRPNTYDKYPLALRSFLIEIALRWCPGLDPWDACVIAVGACRVAKERMG